MIKINNNGKVTADSLLLGYVGEHNARSLDIQHPKFENAVYKLYFDIGNEAPIVMNIANGKVLINNLLLKKEGEVNVQFEASLAEGSLIFKSEVFKMEIERSISDIINAVSIANDN